MISENQDFETIRRWLQKELPEDYDLYDLEHRYDRTLTLEENKSIIEEDLKILKRGLYKEKFEEAKSAMEEYEVRKEFHIKQDNKAAEKQAVVYNQNLKSKDKPNPDIYYKDIHRAVSKVCQKYSNVSFIKGRTGLGKSWNIRKELEKNNIGYVEITGEVTEAYLYRLIYENNGKIIWLNDVVKILSGLKSLNLLKAATESNKEKLLTKSTYSKQQEDLPDSFSCHCRFIFDYNHLQSSHLRDDFEALISRGDFIELTMSEDEIAEVMRFIAKTKEQKEITEFLITNFQANGLFRLNLRTQYKAFKTYGWAMENNLDWKEELAAELKNVSPTRAMLYSLIGKEAVKKTELKKRLMKHQIFNSLRTCDRKIEEWEFMGELFAWSEDQRNASVCINERPKDKIDVRFEM